MRTAAQLLALTAFCLHGWLLVGCEKMVTTVGETSELRSEAGGGSFTAGTGSAATSGSGAAGSGAGVAGVMDADGGVPTKIPSGDGKCVFQPLSAERRPLEMYILLDSNIALLSGGVWELVVQGLRTFARDPLAAGTYVGLRSFGTECVASAYQVPDVAVDQLPNNADIIDLKTMPMGLQTSPTLPALQGGIAFEAGRAVSHPEIEHVVTLVTDGFTGDLSFCAPYLANAVINAAGDGYTQTPSISTYVLVIKNLIAEFTGPLTGIDAMAMAGGTGEPITIDVNNVAGTTLEALHTARRRAQPCEFLLPASVNTDLVSMALLPAADGGTGELPRVADAQSCGGMPGWYFDDPALPTSMYLCPSNCDTLQADNAHRVQPLQGCAPATR